MSSLKQEPVATVITGAEFTIYRDEPIRFAPAERETYTPPQYRAMRKIAVNHNAYRESEPKLFYEQGKFMEDFEDDFDYQGEFKRYFPTYQSMSNVQLRGYFSWRTKVRRGVIEKTPLSFAFVYVYELINQIGVRSPEEGFHTLKNFWAAYKEIDPSIDPYVSMWLKDYAVYYNLDKSLIEGFFDADVNKAVSVLLDYQFRGADEVFAALNSLSSYDLAHSKFFRQHPDDLKNITYDVFAALSEHHDKNCANPRREKFFGRMCHSSYTLFGSVVFYEKNPPKDFVYEVNNICKFVCEDGEWKYERFFCQGTKNRQIGELLKAVDFFARRKYNFKSTLKAGSASEEQQEIISKAVDSYFEKQREAARPKVEIDVSKLQNIREAALETQEKLLVEEIEKFIEESIEEPIKESVEGFIEEPEEAAAGTFDLINNNKTGPENDTGLSDTESLFLKRLLSGHSYDDLIQSKGLLLSVLVDSINEKFFDRFGDTVLSEAEGRAELIADYAEELAEELRTR